MKKTSSLRLAPLCAAMALVGCGAAEASVGVRVLAQDWNPVLPAQQSTRRLVDEPGAVSDALQQAWATARPKVCAALKAKMGLGGAAGGYTLRNIDCVLDANPAFSVAANGANGLSARLVIGGYLGATSTTPDHFDRALDPSFSINVKMNLALKVSVQPNPAQTLRVDAAGFTLSDAKLDSHGLTGDILKFVAGDLAAFFTGTDYKRLAENAVNGVAVDIAQPFNTAFAPVNNRLRPPTGLVRVGLWVRPDLIAVAFGPQAMTPPSGGSLSGIFRWPAGSSPGQCNGLAIAASVQTGPAPLTGVDGRFDIADAPRKSVGDFRLEGTGPAGECRYRVSGLAAGWQNDLALKGKTEAAEVVAVRNGSNRYRYALKGDGWDGTRVTPQPTAQGNYAIVIGPAGSPSIGDEVAAHRVVPSVGIARPGPLERYAGGATTPATNPVLPSAPGTVSTRSGLSAAGKPKDWGSVGATTSPVLQRSPVTAGSALGTSGTGLGASIRSQQSAATRLNPQPLPPEPPPERGGVLARGR